MNKVFWVSLSAAIIAARLSGAAETIPPGDIDEIEELVEKGNWVELRGFLQERPELTQGDDPFSRELQTFLGKTSSLYAALVIDQVKFPDVKNARIAKLNETETALRRSPTKPQISDTDLLLEAELAAIKGPPEPELRPEIRPNGDDDPLLKNTLRALGAPQEAEGSFEVASLDTASDRVTRGRDVARGADEDGLDRAVTSARDAPTGPSIY